MTADVTIALSEKEQVLLVPSTAVFSRVGETYVYVVTDAGEARERRIEVGLEGDGRIQVVKGLREGESIVADGTLSLADGVKIRAAR